MRNMPTKIALVAVALAGTALAGCAGGQAGAAPEAVVVSSAPAGNGITALSADEIMIRARAAVKAAKSVHVKGSIVDDGQDITVDIRSAGADFAATMAFGKAKIDLLSVGGEKYSRPNEAFWVMSTDAAKGKILTQTYGSRWISGADSDQSFAAIFDIGDIDQLLTPDGTVAKAEEKVIAGVRAIGIKDSSDTDTELYVATTGEPLPLLMATKGAGGLTFSSYGETFPQIAAPSPSRVVKLKK